MRSSVPPYPGARNSNSTSMRFGENPTALWGTLNPRRLWGVVFGIWSVILTGIFSQMVGSPGVFQFLELRDLLSQRTGEAQDLEAGIQSLAEAQAALENDPVTQIREIRRVLGFVGSDEIVFEFSDAK